MAMNWILKTREFALMILVVVWAGLILSCGGDSSEASSDGEQGESTEVTPASSSSESSEEESARDDAVGTRSTPRQTSAYEELVSRRVFGDSTRDPFTRPFPEITEGVDGPIDLLSVDLQIEDPVDMGPLAQYSVETLRLSAIITRTAKPVAMFITPDGDSRAHFAYIGDRVGPNGAGFIEDIQPNQVIVAYQPDPTGPIARAIVPLRDTRQALEAEFESY
jgi:Tfp pilus assembly protein PilP